MQQVCRVIHVLRSSYCKPEETLVSEKFDQRRQMGWIGLKGGGMKRQVFVPVDETAQALPASFQRLIRLDHYGAATKTVIRLVACESFMAGVINEYQQAPVSCAKSVIRPSGLFIGVHMSSVNAAKPARLRPSRRRHRRSETGGRGGPLPSQSPRPRAGSAPA